MSYWKSGGPMVRTINLGSCLSKLAPVLSARLQKSDLAHWSGKLLIADSGESAALNIRKSRVNVCPAGKTAQAIRGGDEIAQLLIGTDEPGEVIESAGIRLSGDAKALAPILFPNQHPQLAAWDRY